MKPLFFFFFILIYYSVFSQKTAEIDQKEVSLDTILESIEKSYDIKFSYNPEIIKDKQVSISEEHALHKILAQIQLQALIVFEKINDRYYIIKKRNQKRGTLVCGYLFDKNTRKPISDALIHIPDQSDIIISDSNGYFQAYLFNLNDPIEIQYLGYKTKKIITEELQNNNCTKILLSEENFQLDEVVITEYMTSGISKQGANNVININTSKLGVLPRMVDPDILQTLQFVPGVQSPSETASGLHIRGGTPDHNLILWDGIKMYSSGHFFDLMSIFNPYVTENIKFFRSGTEAKYGSRISGVIDIESKNEVPKDFGMGFGFNMTNADLYIETPINENLGLIVSGRRAFTDLIQTTTFRNYSDRVFQSVRLFSENQNLEIGPTDTNNIFFFSDVTAKLILDASENDKLTISSIFTNNKLDYTSINKNIIGSGAPFDQDQNDNLKFINQGANIRWDKKWSPRFSHSANLYFSNYDFNYRARREFRESSDGFIFFDNNITEENVIRDTGASIHTNWNINAQHSFLSGYDFSTNEVLYKSFDTFFNFTFEESNNNITHAVFSQYKYQSNKVRVSAGLRGNYFSVLDKTYWEPRINLEADLYKKLVTAKVSLERKNQVISQVSNFLQGFNIDNQIWLLADSEVVSMLNSNQFSGGFVVNNNNWHFDIEGYYKRTRGITSYANGFNNIFDLETGDSNVFGIDVLIKKRIQNYRTWIGYSFTDQNLKFENLNEGKTFAGNFEIRHYLSWVHSYQWNNFEFSLGWIIRSGRPYSLPKGIIETDEVVFIDLGTLNSERLDTYHRLDFSASYRFNLSKKDTWRSKIGFSLFNLYNQKNILNRYYDIKVDNTNNSLIQEVDTFSAGITPNLSFRIDF